MGETGRAEQTTKFGIFEVDLRSGELRKSGSRIKLQEQPFKVLQALLERPGEVVTETNCDGSGPTKTWRLRPRSQCCDQKLRAALVTSRIPTSH
jgi:hypothetical protein